MNYLSKLISFFEIFAIVLFIIFEQSVWALALRTYNYIKNLTIFAFILKKLEPLSEYAILLIFCSIFILSKLLSLAAVALLGSGYILLGIGVYLLTFPIGALSIWLLEMQKDKLMSFKWFRVAYNLITDLLNRFKTSSAYAKFQSLTSDIRQWITDYKVKALDIKNNRKEYMTKLLKRYRVIKRYLKIKYGGTND